MNISKVNIFKNVRYRLVIKGDIGYGAGRVKTVFVLSNFSIKVFKILTL